MRQRDCLPRWAKLTPSERSVFTISEMCGKQWAAHGRVVGRQGIIFFHMHSLGVKVSAFQGWHLFFP